MTTAAWALGAEGLSWPAARMTPAAPRTKTARPSAACSEACSLPDIFRSPPATAYTSRRPSFVQFLPGAIKRVMEHDAGSNRPCRSHAKTTGLEPIDRGPGLACAGRVAQLHRGGVCVAAAALLVLAAGRTA